MLLSLTRVGATRQSLAKAVAVIGCDSAGVSNAAARFARGATSANRIQAADGSPGLLTVHLEPAWLGTYPARENAFTGMSLDMKHLAAAAASAGGTLLPTGIGLTGQSAVLGGDTHVIGVLSPVEQEVLCNLLRSHVPTLIAMTGRGLTTSGPARDRMGSRWLMTSRSHLATRYLASTAPQHLDRVKAELRRRDGVASLDRMDVSPGQRGDGTLTVVVRCIDAAASLATARAHAIVLAALALQARRLVRAGRRTGNAPQKQLEENRARAIADGLRARFMIEDQSGRNRPGQPRAIRQVSARNAVRDLLLDLAAEFVNLDVSVEELAPVILPVELPRLGLRQVASETELWAAHATKGEASLIHAAFGGLTDPAAGGPLLRRSTEIAPGRTTMILDLWRSDLARARPGRNPRRDRPDKDGKDRRDRRPAGQPRSAHSGGPSHRDGDRRSGGPARRSGPPRNDRNPGGAR